MNTPANTPKRSTVRTGLAGVAVTTAALLGGLTVLPTLAGAQEGEPEIPTPDSADAEAPRHRHPRGFLKHNAEVVSELLGLTPEEIRDAFLEGTTLAELSEAQGVPVADLIDALVTETETHVAERLQAGDITQEQADRFLDGLEDRITERVNADRPVWEGRGHRGHRGHRGEGAEIVSELLGLTPEEIRDGFQAGSTLAELAQAQGVASEDLVDALVEEAQARVAEKLGSGAITQERADSILEDMEERIEDRVNADRPLERPGRNGRLGHRGSRAADTLDA